MRTHRQKAFTIVELLVVVSIIALLVGILLPAIGKARDQARTSISQTNLRSLAAAHGSYASEWSDRQFTLCADSLGSYGTSGPAAVAAYNQANGATSGGWLDPLYHPGPDLGMARTDAGTYIHHYYSQTHDGNAGLIQPIIWPGGGCCNHFGAFRLINVRQFNQYVSGRFYDKTFYAPKDTVVIDALEECWDDPGEYCDRAHIHEEIGDIPAWASYVLSPAAMFAPGVMAHSDPQDNAFNGWRNPWQLDGAFRSPSFSQASYPNLKTHMLEHHWLQNRQSDCNPGFVPGTFENCEPWYFNHGLDSTPITLFYDGHVAPLGVRQATRADGRMRAQTGVENWGLWSKDTLWGANGYLLQYGLDVEADTSFHILTTDGIRGRDIFDG